MYDYTSRGIEKKLRPHTGRKSVKKAVSAFLKLLLIVIIAAAVGTGIYAYTRMSAIISSAPDISGMTLAPVRSATYICNQEGKRVQKLTLPEGNRDLVKLDDVPKDLQHAVVAIEDERFYEHHGIDPRGIVRAAFQGLTSGSFSQGASTITQQLLKNTVFPDWMAESTFEQKVERKLQEQYLALKLEKTMSKDQILENYLNMINLGAGCFGVQVASYRYFGKSVSDLTLSEDAVIAGITQNPTAYNPIVYPENNEKRRKMVLDSMLRQEYITTAQYEEALADPVYERIRTNEQSVDTSGSVYTFYQDALIGQVMQDLQDELAYTYQQAYEAVYSGGLRIYSAQDDEMQKICDEEFENAANFPEGTMVGIDYALSVQDADKVVTDYGNSDLRAFIRKNQDPSFNLMFESSDAARKSAEQFRLSVVKESDTVLGERITITPQPQASCVVIDQSNGLVRALVGGRGQKEASLTLNRAYYTMRQPGSTFKILTAYAPAIDSGQLTLASTIVDEPYNYEFGTPVYNASRDYQGEVTVREAIVRSINVPAVKVLTQITPQTGYDFAKKFGITTLTDHLETDSGILTDVGQTLALGGISRGVTNLELTGAYAAIANMGHYIAPKFYTEVVDSYGNVLLDNTDPKSRTVLREGTAEVLASAMEGVIEDEDGTAHGLIDMAPMPCAGKTGTTSDWRDSWFVGYTPVCTCGIWAGYDNNEQMPDTGTYHTYSRILWNSIMKRINAGRSVQTFRTTGDTVKGRVCPKSHMAAAPGCTGAYEEIFVQGTQPMFYCDIHGNGGSVSSGDGSMRPEDRITIFNTDQTIDVSTPPAPPQDTPTVQEDPVTAGSGPGGARQDTSQGQVIPDSGAQAGTGQDQGIIIYNSDEGTYGVQGNSVVPEQGSGQPSYVSPDNEGLPDGSTYQDSGAASGAGEIVIIN